MAAPDVSRRIKAGNFARPKPSCACSVADSQDAFSRDSPAGIEISRTSVSLARNAITASRVAGQSRQFIHSERFEGISVLDGDLIIETHRTPIGYNIRQYMSYKIKVIKDISYNLPLPWAIHTLSP